MDIECFDELFNVVYIAKKLFDAGKYDLVTESFFDSLDYDMYYHNMYGLIENLFEHHYCKYYGHRNLELHVISDPVIVDFYSIAGQLGKLANVTDDKNPYIMEAREQIGSLLGFSYCLDWMIMAHTKPKRPFHSRLGLFISHDDHVDLGCLAYRLMELYEWFEQRCIELKCKPEGDALVAPVNLTQEGGVAA